MNNSSKLRTALVAVGGSLAALPAAALELGDVKVHSTLGQPLRASIAYALAPNEAIADTCVSLLPGATASGLPVLSGGSIIVADGVIAITGNAVVREPLVSMRVSIRCNYTPRLTREYLLFIDPVTTTPQPAAQPAAAPVAAPAVSRPVAPAPQPSARRSRAPAEPVANASRYLVQPGDSLSEIAQRIENRPVGLWPAVNAIFAANPDAFMDNDMNRLKAGTWLIIPDLGAGEPLAVAPATTPVGDMAPARAPAAGSAYQPESLAEPATPAREPVPIIDAATSTAPSQDAALPEPVAELEPSAKLEPGDVILNPIDSIADDSVVIPDTALEGPEATSSQPNVPTAIIRPAEPAPRQPVSWLAWFVGGGIALIAGLLLSGWFRGRFGSTPIGAVSEQPVPAGSGTDTEQLATVDDVDYDLDDDSPTAENLALDADLVVGTGLKNGTDVDVVEHFAFANTTNLDLELPEEMSSGADRPQTDIIPPLNIEPESILESEVLPDTDDDYDMSVIVDATKMPDPEDVTERDLEAIELPDDSEALIAGDYTVSQEVDYELLEQDYQDELTATQKLNEEIQKAAEELAISMGQDADDDTKEMSLASVHELDVTAQMRSDNDDEIGDDDTGVNATVALDAEDKTVEMAEDKTVEMAEDKTVEMAEDNTVEMPKRGKAS